MTLTKAQTLLLLSIPEEWMPAYAFVVKQSVQHPEVAGFPALFLAACNGDETAITKVFEFSIVAHKAAHIAGLHKQGASMEKDLTNAVVYLANKLSRKLEQEQHDREDEQVLDFLAETRRDKQIKAQASESEPTEQKPRKDKQHKQDKTSKPGQLIVAIQE
jgi:hypothetical protein